MCVVGGYKSKEGILKIYIFQSATSHLPTRGLHLSKNQHIMRFPTTGNIVILENFNVQTKDDKQLCLTQGYV